MRDRIRGLTVDKLEELIGEFSQGCAEAEGEALLVTVARLPTLERSASGSVFEPSNADS
jgi:hypothetical protein